MIKEVQNEKIGRIEAEDETNIKSLSEEKMMDEKIYDGGIAQIEAQTSSGFVLELFICSLILWSFLFLSHFAGYETIAAKVDSILSTKSSVNMIAEVEEELADVCLQFLSQ